MDTFLILLTIVGVPFVWSIIRMLRFTEETVGEDSLVYGLESSENRTRTYHFSVSEYFCTFFKVMCGTVLVEMLIGLFVVTKVALRQETMPLLVVLMLFALVFLACATSIVFFFHVDWKFWTITRNVWVTFDPYLSSITVEEPTEIDTLTPDTISHIEHHLVKSSNPRYILNGYGCFCFYKTDGQLIWLNNSYFGNFGPSEFLHRFYSHVPITTVWHRFPYRSLIAQLGSMPTAEL